MPADTAPIGGHPDQASEGLCIVGRDGRVESLSPRFAELLDLAPDALRIGEPPGRLSEALHQRAGHGADAARQDVRRLLAEAPGRPFFHECPGSGGRAMEMRGHPLPAGGYIIMVADATERRRAEVATRLRMQASEDLLKQALDNIADGFAVFDSDDRLVMMNKLYVGYAAKDADGPKLGISFEELMSQDRRHGFYPDVAGNEAGFIAERIAAHREGRGRPITFRTSDGRWAQSRDHRLPDGGTVVVRTDVSELVERDRSLRESQASLAEAQRIAKLGSWELDLKDLDNIETNPLRWSDETFRIFGYEPNGIEVSSESFFRAVHPDDRAKIRDAIARTLESGVTYSIEHRIIRPDGHEAVVHEKSDLTFGPDGKRPVRMVGTVQDITEQRAAERTRDEYRTLLEASSEASPDGILVTDAKGRYLFWNQRFKEMWDLSDGFLAARRPSVAAIEADLSPYTDQVIDPRSFVDELVRVYDRGEPPRTAFTDIALKDGRVLDRHAARVDAGKLPYSMVAWIYRDVTEQRKRDAVLAQTQRLTTVGELSGGMAHELNNLLMVIGGNLELIEAHGSAAAETPNARLVKTAQLAVERGAELIRHLLTFSRRQPLAPRLVEVNSFIAETMSMMTRLVGESVTMTFAPGSGVWRTVVDPGFLQTTLVSLATNARDAMPRGGSVIIETSNQTLDEAYVGKAHDINVGEYVLIRVSDNGAGMPPETAKRVFEPFFTTKPVGQGTGLGLSVVYGFVKQSGGHVTIDSEEGRGTSVNIYLPRAPSDSPSGAETAAPPVAQGNRERILVVEDEAAVMAIARAFLSSLGYEVLAASNGEEALAILRSGRHIDLLFSDVVLPDGMNGAELAQAAVSLRPGLKVLFASGYTQEALLNQGRLGSGVQLLPKPYRKRDLALAVKALLTPPS
jgi:PAS domain S-box-containing protein